MVKTRSQECQNHGKQGVNTLSVTIRPAQWVENAHELSFLICAESRLGRMFQEFTDRNGMAWRELHAFYLRNQRLEDFTSAAEQGIRTGDVILYLSYQVVFTNSMWQELEVSTMAALFDHIYNNNIMTRYVQDLVREGVPEVVLEEGLVILAYESMRVVGGLCTEYFFERAVYDAGVHGYEVNKVHVLVKVLALRRSNLGIRQRLFKGG
jgi:hypothetical protein